MDQVADLAKDRPEGDPRPQEVQWIDEMRQAIHDRQAGARPHGAGLTVQDLLGR